MLTTSRRQVLLGRVPACTLARPQATVSRCSCCDGGRCWHRNGSRVHRCGVDQRACQPPAACRATPGVLRCPHITLLYRANDQCGKPRSTFRFRVSIRTLFITQHTSCGCLVRRHGCFRLSPCLTSVGPSPLCRTLMAGACHCDAWSATHVRSAGRLQLRWVWRSLRGRRPEPAWHGGAAGGRSGVRRCVLRGGGRGQAAHAPGGLRARVHLSLQPRRFAVGGQCAGWSLLLERRLFSVLMPLLPQSWLIASAWRCSVDLVVLWRQTAD